MRRLLSPVPIAVVIAVVALLGLLAYGVRSTAPDATLEQALATGDRPTAADTRLPRLDGRGQASLAEFRGRVVVLNYWASWCEPCRTESPLLERWHRWLSGRGGTVVGVDVMDVSSDARSFVREFGLTYPMLRDADGATQRSFGIVAYPETIVIDRAGRIAALRRGPVDESFMRSEVAPLLGEGS